MDASSILAYLYQHYFDLLMIIPIALLGFLAARFIRYQVIKRLPKLHNDDTFIIFLGNVIYALLLVILLIIILGKLGVPTASLITLVAASGLAVGLALQSSLANVASGILLVFLRHFKVGDYIISGGVQGTVEQINIFTTYLKTSNNEVVIIPNAKLTSDNIINQTAKPLRRIDLTISVAYEADLKHAEAILKAVCDQSEAVLPKPEPYVGVRALGANSVDFAVRTWVKRADYAKTQHVLLAQIKLALDEEKIDIPYPQLTLHHSE